MNSISDFSNANSLNQLGWKPYFQQQLTLDDYEQGICARVVSQSLGHCLLATETGTLSLSIDAKMPALTIGDWLILNHDLQFVRLLERRSLLSFSPENSARTAQLVASNLDTIFIFYELNQEFNIKQITQHLALAKEAEVEPVVILANAEQCPNADELRDLVQNLDPFLMVEVVNTIDEQALERLLPWCGAGRTIALLGALETGTSSLIAQLASTNATTPSIQRLAQGGLVIDTPLMAEFQRWALEDEDNEQFADIEKIAEQCRFADCRHQNEPGCAVARSIKNGVLSEQRVSQYAEMRQFHQRHHTSVSQKAHHRQQDKHFRTAQDEKRKRRMAN